MEPGLVGEPEGSTRERLVAATLAELDEKGYGALRVLDVAHRAGLTTGAIYSAFGTKHALVAASLISRDTDAFLAALDRSERADNRPAVLEAALFLLDARGYRQVRMSDVARRARVPEAELRRAFPSKHHVLAAAIVATDPERFAAAADEVLGESHQEGEVDGGGQSESGEADEASSTRDRLIAAALEVLDASGYRDARIGDIARRAGLTTGAVYANFDSKHELLDMAMARRYGDLFRVAIDRAHRPEDDGLLSGVAAALTQDAFVNHRALVEVMAAASRDDAARAPIAEAVLQRDRQIVRLIDAGKNHGRMTSEVPTGGLAHVVQLLALGNIVARALDLPSPSPGEIATTLRLLGEGLSSARPTSPRGSPTSPGTGRRRPRSR